MTPGYVELAMRSNFSFLKGASRPEELVVTVHRLAHHASALADENTVAGTVRAWKMADTAGIAYHPGCRLVFSDGNPDMLAYPRDRAGWGRLCRMLTQANLRGEKGKPQLLLADLMEWGEGMSLALLPLLGRSGTADETSHARKLADRFGQALRIAVAPLHGGEDAWRIEAAAAMAAATCVPLMAVNDVLYHDPARRPLQDVVTAIRLGTQVGRAGYALSPNAERYPKPPEEMARLFARHPEAITETIRFAGELSFTFRDLKYNYPDEAVEGFASAQEALEALTWQGAARRWPQGIPEAMLRLLRHELGIVGELNYARYFLTVHDIMAFAHSRGIWCQGRGSAANSVICYCLRITDVGPDIMDHLFERFISRERGEPPDIDVDFEHDRRDEVIAYIYERYSQRRTALAAAVVTYRSRSAMREVAKAMGLSSDVTEALSASVWGWSSEVGERETRSAGLDAADPLVGKVIGLANDIMGFPRHLSQHVGGFVITRDRLDEVVPIMPTAMDERRMVEWDKDDLDAVGILKVDILALGMLSCLRRGFDLLESRYGRRLDLSLIPQEDGKVYDMICRADTLGVFQIESRAQMSMLPRLRPRTFYDLVIEVAIVRPGPIQGDMVHPYLRRRQGLEPEEYQKEELRNILGRTLGVPLFQEQAMKIAIVAGGFSPGEADRLRRAMATFRRVGTIGTLRDKMIEGMVARGYERAFADRCFKQIEGFGEYGFPESHAASFALLVYASCWLKAYYPDVFCAALLNSQPMGFYAPAQIVRDAADHGVEIRPVDVNLSDWDALLEPTPFNPGRISSRHAEMRDTIATAHAVRLGLRQVKGLSQPDMERLMEARGSGYGSVRELWLRAGLAPHVLQRLAEADAFRSLGLDRRAALWAVRALDRRAAAESLPLFEGGADPLMHEARTELPAMPQGEHVIQDYRTLSLSLKAHPVTFLREELERRKVMPCAALSTTANGRRVSVAGLVLVRQRPGSAKGVIFMTIEDEGGIANIIVWNKMFERYRPIVLGARMVRVDGRLQVEAGVIHIVASRITDLTPLLARLSEKAMPVRSRAGQQGKEAAPIDDGMFVADGAGFIGGAPASGAHHGDLARQSARVMPRGRNFH